MGVKLSLVKISTTYFVYSYWEIGDFHSTRFDYHLSDQFNQ